MRRVAVPFPIVVYPSEDSGMGIFTAHCLNLDIIADDDTVEGAISTLLELIDLQLSASEAHCADPFCRAPEEYWEKFRSAARIPNELADRIIMNANRCNVFDRQQLEIHELQPA